MQSNNEPLETHECNHCKMQFEQSADYVYHLIVSHGDHLDDANEELLMAQYGVEIGRILWQSLSD